MKNILIISYAYPPANLPSALRPYYFAKYLGLSGANVTVLCAKNPDSVYGINPGSFKLSNVAIRTSFNLDLSSIRRIKSKVRTGNITHSSVFNLKFKVLNLLESFVFPDKGMFWVPSATISAFRFIRKNEDISVYSTSPLITNHLVAYIQNKLFGVDWVADFRDFYFIHNPKFKGHSIKSVLHKILEKKFLKSAKNIVFISSSMQNLYSKHYPMYRHKFACITNGIDLELYLSQKKKTTRNERLKIAYSGSFYNGERDPFVLLNALEKMVREKLIDQSEFIIDIYGVVEKSLEMKIKSLIISGNININGIISKPELLKSLKAADVLWLIVGESPHHKAGIPFKLFDYLSLNKIIWAFLPLDSHVNYFLNELRFGEIFTPDDENIYTKKILKYFKLFRDEGLLFPEELSLIKLEPYSHKYRAELLKTLIDSK